MKKFAFAAAALAAIVFSGSAFAASADSAKGLQISHAAVKISNLRPVRHYRVHHYHYPSCCTPCIRMAWPCGCGCGVSSWTWGWGGRHYGWRPPF